MSFVATLRSEDFSDTPGTSRRQEKRIVLAIQIAKDSKKE